MPYTEGMAELECYVCPLPATAEVCPALQGHMWAVPLCREHLGIGTALLMRMFPDDSEAESACEVLRVGEWQLLDPAEVGHG